MRAAAVRSRCLLLLVATLSSSAARMHDVDRSLPELDSDSGESGAVPTVCNLKESESAWGFGIRATFPVGTSCKSKCQHNVFWMETIPAEIIADPEPKEEDGRITACACKYKRHFHEAGDAGSKTTAWFSFRIHTSFQPTCDRRACKQTYETWANAFLKAMHSPSEVMPRAKLIGSHENYEMHCQSEDSSVGNDVVLPSPADKLTELDAMIAGADEDTRRRLEKVRSQVFFKDESIEIFAYDRASDWGPARPTEDGPGGDRYSTYNDFQLKPCRRLPHGPEVQDLEEIFEVCGEPVLGETVKLGKRKAAYDTREEWGPEREVDSGSVAKFSAANDACPPHACTLQSLRLKPCKVVGTQEEITDLDEILDSCGQPVPDISLLLGKASLSLEVDLSGPIQLPPAVKTRTCEPHLAVTSATEGKLK